MTANTNPSATRPWPCGGIFDAPTQKKKLAETEEQIAAPDFWNQPEKSQKVMQARKRLEEAIANDDRIRGMTDDLDTLFELAREGESCRRPISSAISSPTPNSWSASKPPCSSPAKTTRAPPS